MNILILYTTLKGDFYSSDFCIYTMHLIIENSAIFTASASRIMIGRRLDVKRTSLRVINAQRSLQ